MQLSYQTYYQVYKAMSLSRIQRRILAGVVRHVNRMIRLAELITPIFANRSVKRASKFMFHGKGNTTITSYTLGSKIQLCIYDKRRELIDTCDEVKMSLLVNDCLGGEFPDEWHEQPVSAFVVPSHFFPFQWPQVHLHSQHAPQTQALWPSRAKRFMSITLKRLSVNMRTISI